MGRTDTDRFFRNNLEYSSVSIDTSGAGEGYWDQDRQGHGSEVQGTLDGRSPALRYPRVPSVEGTRAPSVVLYFQYPERRGGEGQTGLTGVRLTEFLR